MSSPGWDPIYGGIGRGRGRAAAAFARLQQCVLLIRNTEVSDDVALGMLREAAGDRRDVLVAFAKMFTSQDWYRDPLLLHVSNLVKAASTDSNVVALNGDQAEVARAERRLLGASPSDAYARLTELQPLLDGLATSARDRARQPEQAQIGDWRVQHLVGGKQVSPLRAKVARWVGRRVFAVAEGVAKLPLETPPQSDLRSAVAELRHPDLIGRELAHRLLRLVGPAANTDIPLLRTRVAEMVALRFLEELRKDAWQ